MYMRSLSSSMPALQRNASLKPYHTFGVDVRAAALAEFHSVEELGQLLSAPEWKDMPHLFLGGGSNVLFVRDYDGLVLRNRIRGITTAGEDNKQVWVRAGAGVVWQDLVQYTLDRGLSGLENLSLIPGLTGAAPMQNIGAYGVELKDVFTGLEALEIATGKIVIFDKDACQFGYRDSFFKSTAPGQYVILSVTLRLEKKPLLRLDYGNLREALAQRGIENPTPRDVSEAVIAIRRSKLPDPAELGNAGSFFKNPEMSKDAYLALAEAYPGMPHFALTETRVKVPAAWLIEQCGWKGKRVGRTGAHEQHALVLVNYGGARGTEIWRLAENIRESVLDKFGIALVPEVNVIG